VVAGLTAISGAIQGAAYAHAVGLAGWAMGIAMPLFGELGASLALSIYAKEQQARSMDEDDGGDIPFVSASMRYDITTSKARKMARYDY
jgi:hypothetical protein